MPVRRTFDENKIIRRIKPPNIKTLCPKQYIYFGDGTFYVFYKYNDLTFPDVGKMTIEWYNRPMMECYWGTDTMNGLNNFLNSNIKQKDNVVKFVEELALLDDIDIDKIEAIFNKYKSILFPTCELYRFCYYLPTMFVALDIRTYKGQPTKVNRSLMVKGIINFLKGKITKEQALKIWNDIAGDLEPGDTLESLQVSIVKPHDKELKSDRFTNKKDETVHVDSYPRIIKKMKD